ncbi:hypothetical protein [Chelatococcus asaccharovorans]|uniref:DUF488 domain-containing protein n=1 Tax=Chelatococcus asaccharovorans TaxID=28210 RepID=A0A2V3UAS8_9HYPH|nr:hypothetical protein [Chelatococcus asaccharovorans]MBS7703281.1 hypothetical protein [Chelatococcus asaccharovorans]PXW61613.1 hypothetical protein C7450_103130 [Chelatococcus asaccharovorans]
MIEIYTASWFAQLPDGIVRVGVSRGVPRGQPAGYRRYTKLNPGSWFNSVGSEEYLRRYKAEVLGRLMPDQVAKDLEALTGGKPAALLCYESPLRIEAGSQWCHRHIVAAWLEHHLGIKVEEVDYPQLDRFAQLKREGVSPPTFG